MNNIIQHSKQFSNGAPVVTPDKFAVKARVTRTKRVMREVKKGYQVMLNKRKVEREERLDRLHVVYGVLAGIAYCSLLLFVNI